MNLTPSDYEKLKSSWILPEGADSALLHRVTSAEGGELIGRNGNGDYSGIVFSYFWPGEAHPREYVLRVDNPGLEHKSDGSLKERLRYIFAPGRSNIFYFSPDITPQMLADISLPCIFCEGPKKYLAFLRLATEGREYPRLLPVGLNGVWGWRGKTGIEPGPDGTRQTVKGPIPDFARIPLEGRAVYVCFDSDRTRNASIQAAERELAKELKSRGATVRIVELPDLSGLEKTGADDFLAHPDGGPEGMLELIEKAKPADVETESGLVKKLADAILEVDHFCQDAGGELFHFKDGVYKPRGTEFVKRQVKSLLEEWGMSKAWSTKRGAETAEYIRLDAPRMWERPALEFINLKNGLLDVRSRLLLPHSPEVFSSVQLPIEYRPSATCEHWDRFVEQTFPEDAQSVAWEILAWLMLPIISIQRAVLLLGEGANGKSRFLKAIVSFLGRGNTTAISLHRLEDDRFSVARLVGKLANICPDLPSEHLTSTSTFKAIVGGDILQAERKYCDSFEFSPFCRLLFSANHAPRSSDSSSGFFRRWLVIPFDRVFTEGSPEHVSSDVLDARLADSWELSGALNRALAVLPDVSKGKISEPESMRRAAEEFREITDPLAVWLEAETIEGPDLIVSKRGLLEAYNLSARNGDRPSMTATAFGIALRRLRPGIKDGQRTLFDTPKQHVWLGIGLKAH